MVVLYNAHCSRVMFSFFCCIHKTLVKIKCKFKPFNSNQKWWYYLHTKNFFVNSQGNFLKLLTCLTFSKSKINLIVRFYMISHFLFGPSNFHNTKKTTNSHKLMSAILLILILILETIKKHSKVQHTPRTKT